MSRRKTIKKKRRWPELNQNQVNFMVSRDSRAELVVRLLKEKRSEEEILRELKSKMPTEFVSIQAGMKNFRMSPEDLVRFMKKLKEEGMLR